MRQRDRGQGTRRSGTGAQKRCRLVAATPVSNDVLVGLDGTEGIEELANQNGQPGRGGHEQVDSADIAGTRVARCAGFLDRPRDVNGLPR